MWVKIEGASGYEVSDAGEVRSVDRVRITANGQRRFYRGKVFRGFSQNQYGHKKVPITYDNGEKKMRYIHHLVADAFLVESDSNRPLVCHGPGGVFDNSKTNLSRGNALSNAADKYRDGTNLSGDAHPSSVLSWEQVDQIRLLLGAKTQKEIAKIFGVSRTNISAIATGRSWKDGPTRFHGRTPKPSLLQSISTYNSADDDQFPMGDMR